MSKDEFEELIEIKDKMISSDSSDVQLSMPKHLGADKHDFQGNFEEMMVKK
jgi:hypothetical protein